MTCPGCDSHTSTVLARYLDGEPCPYCGLSATATQEIIAARQRGADADLTAKYTELVKRVDAAEGQARRHLRAITDIREILARLDQPEESW